MTILKKEKKVLLIPDQKLNMQTGDELQNIFSQITKADSKEVIMDFKNVENIDCFALDKILSLKNSLEQKGSKLRITNIQSSYVQRFFSLLNLKRVIEIEH